MSFAKHPMLAIAAAFAFLFVSVGITIDAEAARNAAATGFYRSQKGQAVIPLQFVLSTMPGGGSHNFPLMFPNDDVMIDGNITLTGKGPATITFPQHLQSGGYSALVPLMGSTNIQVSTSFTVIRAPEAMGGAVFSPSGGPGSFSFCPGPVPGTPGAMCPTTGGGAPNLATAPQGTGTRHGRIVYLGGSGFGGVSQVFLIGSGTTVRPRMGFGFGSPIFHAGAVPFGGSGTQAPGGAAGFLDYAVLGMAVYTQPKTAPTTNQGLTSMNFGPVVTSMNAVTSCPATPMGGAYPNIPLTGSLACATGMGPPLVGPTGSTTNTGFPFTTGTVLAQATTAATVDLFSFSGSDARTSRGIGNITMVAGALATRNNILGTQGGGQLDTISITVSKKAPSMSATGLAAAALLMVLGAGYAMRRKF